MYIKTPLFFTYSCESFFESKKLEINHDLAERKTSFKENNKEALAKEIAIKHQLIVPKMSAKPQVIPNSTSYNAAVIYIYQYEGESNLFLCKPKSKKCIYTSSLISVISPNEITFSVENVGSLQNPRCREAISMKAKQIKEYIDCCLEEINEEIKSWNVTLEIEILAAIKHQ